jgi:hypothetical protein
MPRKLKVYRTPVGFHDAYVAAPSQKAALEAWGTKTNLFARGVAELVTEDALMQAPLESPGQVIRLSRGSVEEQLAALPPDRPASKPKTRPKGEISAPRKAPKDRHQKERPKTVEKPRPSRIALDKAEAQLDALLTRQNSEEDALRQKERALARERRDVGRRHERERKSAEQSVEREREAHAGALSRWRDTR